MKRRHLIFGLPAAVLFAASLQAQSVPADSIRSGDTLTFVPQMEQRPAGEVTNAVNLEKHLIQSPTRALFKSMLVPGLGQMGNRRWFKASLFVGLQTWFALKAIDHGQAAHAHRARFEAETDPVFRGILHSAYDTERSDRNKFIWFFGLTTFVSMFDAYVDAHLSGSPSNRRNDQFSVGVTPDLQGGGSVSFAVRF
jgi:hypothetical protein